jgi:integrase
MKKIRGTIYYFGNWARRVEGVLVRVDGDGAKEAEAAYNAVREDLHAGRTPRVKSDGLTVKELCNHFLTAKLRKKDAGEMGLRTFNDYKGVTDQLVASFGANRLVDDLAADDFAALRATMAKNWGPVRLANAITRVKSVFKYGTDNGLVERTIRYGSEFGKPDKAVMRRHRAAQPAKMFEAAELRTLIDGALLAGESGPELVKPDPALRAMILLGINCAFGNTDCAALTFEALDLDGGWGVYPRAKTGIARRCPLWPETVAALREAIAARPEPRDEADRERVFLTSRGNAYIHTTGDYHKDQVAVQFTRLLGRLDAHRRGVGYYALRHTFRTVADELRDQPAIDLIMGHTDPSMAAHYRERIEDARLRAVADHVRKWVFGDQQATGN